MLSVRIPQDRVGVLIGTHGSTKAEIEKISGLKIDVDSETGEVIIDGTSASDPEMPLKVREVVRAIGRGFSPKKAYRLFDSGVYLEIIDLKDFVGKNSKRMKTVRARLIGTNGKTRRIIEELSEAEVSIYGNTVAIIGDYLQLDISRNSIMMILNGNQHGTVYKYLERRRKDVHLSRLDSI